MRAADLRFTREETRELLAGGDRALGRGCRACFTRGPRAGRRACGWRPSRSPSHPTPSDSSPSSPAASARSPTTCWPRCSSASPPEVRRPPAAHVDPRAGERTAGRRPHRKHRLGADPARPSSKRTRSSSALDVERTWFRYHHLFADLLRLELRRTDPGASTSCTGPPPVVRGARVSGGRSDPARPGRRGLGVRRPPPRRPHLRLLLKGAGRDRRRAADRVPEEAARRIPSRAMGLPVISWSRVARRRGAYIALAERHAADGARRAAARASSCCSPSRASRSPCGAATSVPSPTHAQPLLDPVGAGGAPVSETSPGGRPQGRGGDEPRHRRGVVVADRRGRAGIWKQAPRPRTGGSTCRDRRARACWSHLALAVARLFPHPPHGSAMPGGSDRGRRGAGVGDRADRQASRWRNDGHADRVWQGRFAEAEPWAGATPNGTVRPDLEPTTALLAHLTRGILHLGPGPA